MITRSGDHPRDREQITRSRSLSEIAKQPPRADRQRPLAPDRQRPRPRPTERRRARSTGQTRARPARRARPAGWVRSGARAVGRRVTRPPACGKYGSLIAMAALLRGGHVRWSSSGVDVGDQSLCEWGRLAQREWSLDRPGGRARDGHPAKSTQAISRSASVVGSLSASSRSIVRAAT